MIRAAREWLFGCREHQKRAAASNATESAIREAREMVKDIDEIKSLDDPLADLVHKMIVARRLARRAENVHL